ncbi:PQQ-binding-like beta-propeller repeat protein [Amorphoplanes digitatis]|uniref:Uncharacterized protein n=1 Tax=Actinoplanes digitatis TaxID=1868 RepID=A0A7W7HXK8_9ACTN|nr:PQQ-binding-like beta-propeller repeat protein [Actinoplanes digitatis]MBB4762629.1 hypothetical protein [Actinoplanes digitatis]GID91871.1 hypothetical protein Adi01nite_12830 [Actinoplanes digitatis]
MPDDEGGHSGPETRSTAAGTLVTIGALLLLVGWFRDEGVGDHGLSPVAGRWLGVLVVLLCVLVAWARHQESPGTTTRRRWVITALAVSAALAATAFHVVDGLRRYGDGYPGVVAPLGVAGGVAVIAGLLLGAVRPAEGRWRRWNALRLAAVASVSALLVAACVPVALTSGGWAVRSATASAVAVPPVPATVSRVGWTTPMPGPVRDVRPAGAGAVVLLSDGVLGVDGSSGAIRWSYRRLGARAAWMVASPDGGSVVLGMLPQQDGGADTMLILDAMTGAVRSTGGYSADLANPHQEMITDDVLVGQGLWDDDRDYPAFSLRDGGTAWTWRRPEGCRGEGFRAVGALHHRIVISAKCGAESKFFVLDSATGRQVAEHVVAITPQGSLPPEVVIAPDRSLALLKAYEPVRPEQAVQLLDAGSDRILPMPVPLYRLIGYGLATDGKISKPPLLRDARTGEVRYQQEISSCAFSGVLLESMVLCVRRGDYSWVKTFLDTGKAALTLTPLGTQQPADLPVELGPRNEHDTDRPLELVAANGAVIVYSGIDGRDGSHDTLVGLR